MVMISNWFGGGVKIQPEPKDAIKVISDNKTDFDKKMDRCLDDLVVDDLRLYDIYENSFVHKGYIFDRSGKTYNRSYSCRPTISSNSSDYDKIKTYYFVKPHDQVLVDKIEQVFARRENVIKDKNIRAFDGLLGK